jgi:hypothetical protein
MSNPNETKIVTVDDGNGPVKAVKDGAGRLLSKEHVKALRDKQQAELDQVTQVRDKLAANDATTKTDIVGQFKDRMAVQMTMMDRQKSQMQDTLAKLDAGDAKTVASVVSQMVQQLSRRVEGIQQARNQSDALLAELEDSNGGNGKG